MQFSIIALFATAVFVDAAITTVKSEVVATITSCGPEVTNCPAASSAPVIVESSSIAPNATAPIANVSTYEGAANKQFAAGAFALAAGALLL
ncbi:unnamed protein product [Candida verbasci]|uniref:Uncharacterized protein n=1 Tax=Candida verbasci TaxID=1227364 RepID=A0A9W4XMY1_9ASCO|nr:unnamed protein product [Candida verbasci]